MQVDDVQSSDGNDACGDHASPKKIKFVVDEGERFILRGKCFRK